MYIYKFYAIKKEHNELIQTIISELPRHCWHDIGADDPNLNLFQITDNLKQWQNRTDQTMLKLLPQIPKPTLKPTLPKIKCCVKPPPQGSPKIAKKFSVLVWGDRFRDPM